MIRRPPRSTHCISSAASDVYKRQVIDLMTLISKNLSELESLPSSGLRGFEAECDFCSIYLNKVPGADPYLVQSLTSGFFH